LDILPENIGRNTPVAYGLVGRVEEVLPVISRGIKYRERPAWRGRLTQLKSDWAKRIAGEMTAAGRPVPPARLVAALERAMADDAVVALDVGDHTVWFNRIFSGTNQTVLASGNWREPVKETEPYEVIDARDRLVMPGLINTHTHAAMVLFRGVADDLPLMTWLKEKIWPLEARLTAEHVYWGTRLAINEMLLSGTTTFADMYFFLEEEARAVEETGIRAVLSRGLIGLDEQAERNLEE